MTLKGEIETIIRDFAFAKKEGISGRTCDSKVWNDLIDQAISQILSAIKGRVPEKKPVRKENSQPLGMSESLDNIKNQGFNEARNQFLNEVEG
jgi:hypothetical protein